MHIMIKLVQIAKFHILSISSRFIFQKVYNRKNPYKNPGAFCTGFTLISYADPESFVSGGPNLIMFFFLFLFDEGIQDPNTAINGPSSAGPKLNAGLFQRIGTSTAKKSYIFVIFHSRI